MLHFARWFEAMDIIKMDVEKGNYFNETINMRIVNQCEYFIEKNRMDKEYFIDLWLKFSIYYVFQKKLRFL